MIRRTQVTLATALLPLLCCGGSSQGTEPHDMTAAQHEATAGHEQQLEAQHEQQYDPKAEEKSRECEPHHRGCWTSVTNPTQEHLDQAREHRELAEKHRAAAQALRDAEAQSCAGLE